MQSCTPWIVTAITRGGSRPSTTLAVNRMIHSISVTQVDISILLQGLENNLRSLQWILACVAYAANNLRMTAVDDSAGPAQGPVTTSHPAAITILIMIIRRLPSAHSISVRFVADTVSKIFLTWKGQSSGVMVDVASDGKRVQTCKTGRLPYGYSYGSVFDFVSKVHGSLPALGADFGRLVSALRWIC